MAFAQLYTNTLSLLAHVSILQLAFYCAYFCLLAALGAGINCIIDATSAFMGRKNLIGKLACQGSQSIIASLLFYLVFLGALIPLPGGENPAAFITPYFAEMAPFLLIVFACAITLTVFWTKIPNTFITYLFTVVTTLALLIQAGWWLIQDYTPLQSPRFDELLLPAGERIIQAFDMAIHGNFLITAAFMIFAACATGSMVLMVWLIVRRNWDDFGRDYYVFAMHRAARRSLLFLVLTVAVACYLNWQLYTPIVESFFVSYALLLALSVLLLIVIAIMLIGISFALAPMRYKLAAIACLCLFAVVFFIQLIVVQFSPSLA